MSENNSNESSRSKTVDNILRKEKYKKDAKNQEAKAEPSQNDEGHQLQITIKAKDEEIQKLKDQLLRTLADMDNLRKREEKFRMEEKVYAISSFAKDLIDGIENLFRTLENLPVDVNDEALIKINDGVSMTLKSFLNAFEKNSLERINPKVGEKFDHNYHEAVAQVPNGEYEEGSVFQVMQAGYRINNRLLRPAMVVVTKKS